MKKQSAFTLIELLVVICIIAILAGIALPVFGRVTERAHATGCMNNLRQIGIGTAAYLSDHDDMIFKTDDNWPQLLNTDPTSSVPGKYVPNWKAFKSDFDTDQARINATGANTAVSYGININILTQTVGTDAWDGNVAKMDSPSQLIYMAPAYTKSTPSAPAVFAGTAGGATSAATPLKAGGLSAQSFGTHSNGKQINVLYMDSHVASLKFGPVTNVDTFQNTASDEGKKRWLPKMPASAPTP